MIYKKCTKDAFAVKREDLPVAEKPPFSALQRVREEKEDRLVFNDEVITQKIRKMRNKRHRFRRILVSCTLFVFVLCAVDLKFFGGYLCTAAGNFTKRNAVMLLEGLTEEVPVSDKQPERTLYTMQYAETEDVLKTEPTDNTPLYDSSGEYQNEVAADSLVSGGFVDGVTYYPITERDLSASSVFALSNGTTFDPDLETLSQGQPSSLENLELTDEPLVLIVHTHGGECYSEYTEMYPKDEPTRSFDADRNVVRVGREILSTLSDFGIPALHCEIQHDKDSFINAYSESAKTVKKYLQEYPGIRFVIDVHRDAIIRDDGESIKAVRNIGGQDYAQLMFVVGTNDKGHNHPEWQQNLSLAVTLQKSMEETYPGLCRSINLRDVPFNQQLSDGYLLLEVGTSANTLDEALLSARAFAENLARVIRENV